MGEESESRCLLSQLIKKRNDIYECICSRPVQDVLCKACQHVFMGRARKQCVLHPRSIHLMDYGNCPQCKNVYLCELRPHQTAGLDTPEEMDTGGQADANINNSSSTNSRGKTFKEVVQMKIAGNAQRMVADNRNNSSSTESVTHNWHQRLVQPPPNNPASPGHPHSKMSQGGIKFGQSRESLRNERADLGLGERR